MAWKLVPFKPVVKPAVNAVRYSQLTPLRWHLSLKLFRIIAFGYGHRRSAVRLASLDAAGEPLPWITYPAIEFLKQLDLSDKDVFEYGCGGSTIFWGRQARHVDSVEHEPEFYELVGPALRANCSLRLERDPEAYLHAVARRGEPYDVIMIDGHSRVRCAETVVPYLREGGMVILDNSDWFHQASAALRGAGLIEVDMTGFSPINEFTSTTSFYFDRRYNFAPKADRQPVGGIGSKPKPYFPKVTAPAVASK
jgi:hypothetical protein